MRRTLDELFGIDLRSLALFRIGLGFTLLLDLALRARDLIAHYTDTGVLPRSVLIDKVANVWHVSVHLMNGTAPAQAALFLIAGLFAFALLVGYRTRPATLVSWGLLISLHGRNPMVLQGSDFLLRVLLFWSLFLPLGARYSVDSLLNTARHPSSPRVLSVGTAAILLQVAIVYWFTGLLKSGPEWRTEGSAIYYALSLDHFAKPLGIWLRQFPELLAPLTRSVLWFETLAPLALFLPVWTGPMRAVLVLAFCGLQLGFWSCLELGLFPLVSSLAMLVFVPTWAWNLEIVRGALAKRLRGLYQRLVVTSGLSAWLRRHLTGRPVTVRSSAAANLVAAGLLVYVVCWNLGHLNPAPVRVSQQFKWLASVLQLTQKWDMFAPAPMKNDGWYIFPGTLRDGTQVDLFPGGAGGPVRWEKPALVSAMYPNHRWRKYLVNLQKQKNKLHRQYVGRYLCRAWNARHKGPKRLDRLEIVYMRERTLLEGRTAAAEKLVLREHTCQ